MLRKKKAMKLLNGYLRGGRRTRCDFFPFFLFVYYSLLFLYWPPIFWKKFIQCKNLHAVKCNFSMDGEIWRIRYLLRLQSSFFQRVKKLVDLGDLSSGSWRTACLLSLPSPLPFVGTESRPEQQSLLFIQVIQYTFTEHLLHARHQSAGGGSSYWRISVSL